MPKQSGLTRAEMALRKIGLTYPESHEDFPWGHRAIKVLGKMFVILSQENDRLNVTMKLPVSNPHALALPFTSPTGYGMGKHGSVTAQFNSTDEIPLEMLREWIDESFRAVAPKRVLAALEIEDDVKVRAKPKRAPGKSKRPT